MIIPGYLFFALFLSFTSMNTQIQYEYADGSGNTFLLSSLTLEYVPVTPERSSSEPTNPANVASGVDGASAEVTARAQRFIRRRRVKPVRPESLVERTDLEIVRIVELDPQPPLGWGCSPSVSRDPR